MKFLLDVNALIAWHHADSPHHAAFHTWASHHGFRSLATCAHSELGFLRVSMQAFQYSLPQAAEALASMKPETGGFIKSAPSPALAAWADTPKKTSDAYLAQLAAANRLTLATFDTAIPGAHRIA